MVLSLIKNIMPKSSVKKEVPVKEEKKEEPVKKEQKKRPKYKTAINGAMFGVGVGLGDGLVTSISIQKELKKNLSDYKTYTFSEKRKAVEQLHIGGFSKKDVLTKLKPSANVKMMLTRGAFYGAIVAGMGFAIDTWRNYTSNHKK